MAQATANAPSEGAAGNDPGTKRSGWWWVPTLYFGEGIPYVLVMTVAAIMYKKMGVDNAKITFWTGLLYLPWVIKPLWGPLVDLYWTKRNWVIWLQLLMGGIFGYVAFALNLPGWWVLTLAAFAVTAFVSATHDIAADGFYMLGLDAHRQALFVGVRSTFYRFAMIVGQGILIILVGMIEAKSGPPPVLINLRGAASVAEMPAAATPQRNPESIVVVTPDTPVLAPGTTMPLEVKLSKQPETTVVVSIMRKPSTWYANFFPVGAEQLLSVDKGDRIEIGPGDWDKPHIIIAGAHKGLADHQEVVSANFQATAGNIVLSWTVCFASMAVLFVLLFAWHLFAIPKPLTDGATAAQKETRPSFARAGGWMLLTILVPIIAFTVLFYGIKMPTVAVYLKMKELAALSGDIDTLWTFFTIIAICLVVWLIFQSGAVRETTLRGFRGAARHSGIPFDEVFISFFRKKQIGIMIAFLLTFRLGEAMLIAMAKLFLIAPREEGGLNLSVAQFGLAYGTVGVLGLLFGGITGGVLAATGGLKKWLLPMWFAINVPHALYIYLAYAKPDNFPIVLGCVTFEQFCYGFGFAAYMLYMLYIAGEGEHKTSHFAITTGFMALSMMLPGMFSGALQKLVGGYGPFFIIVVATMLIGLVIIYLIPLDPEFGKKKKA